MRFANFKSLTLILTSIAILFLPASSVMSAPPVPRPTALVYFGPGVCPGCPDDLASALARAGFKIKKAFPGNITPEALSNAALFAVPGGDEERDVMHALQPGEASAIKNFVEAGGHYLGVCLGAYLAVPTLIDTQTSEAGLNLFNGTVTNHSPTKEARMEWIAWKSEHRWMYFQDGPEFHLNDPASADIWARYNDGSIAAFQSKLGLGKVGLIGPHLEATEEWLLEDDIAIPTGEEFRSSQDLLKQFLSELLN